MVLVNPLPAAGRYWLVSGLSRPSLAMMVSLILHWVPVGPAFTVAMPWLFGPEAQSISKLGLSPR